MLNNSKSGRHVAGYALQEEIAKVNNIKGVKNDIKVAKKGRYMY